jgi:hypothetical protein
MATIINIEEDTSKKGIMLDFFEKMKAIVYHQLDGEYTRKYIDKVWTFAKEEFEKMIPDIPYFGGKKTILTQLAILSGISMAVYMAFRMVMKNKTLARATTIAVVKAYTDTLPKIPGEVIAAWMMSNLANRRFDELPSDSWEKKYPLRLRM